MAYYKYIRTCKKCEREFKAESTRLKICKDCRLVANKVQVYTSTFFKHRIVVLKRDNYKCRNCDWKEEDSPYATNKRRLIVHHIDCLKSNQSFSNLITLCEKCHLGLHNYFPRKRLREENIFDLFAILAMKKEKEKDEFFLRVKKKIKPRFFKRNVLQP